MATMTASDLFARVKGSENFGPEKCHWCGSACTTMLTFEEPPPTPFVKTAPVFARNRNGIHLCVGCWSYRWKRVTVQFLGGGYRDSQMLAAYSWVIVPGGVYVVSSPADRGALYRLLLEPPTAFSLSLLETGRENLLQCAELNFGSEIIGQTPLKFTVDNAAHHFTVYDLEEALAGGVVASPGVRTLLRVLGPFDELKKEVEKKRRGRPAAVEDKLRKVVSQPATPPSQFGKVPILSTGSGRVT